MASWATAFSAHIEAWLDAFLLTNKAGSTLQSCACQLRLYALFCQQLLVPNAMRFEPTAHCTIC